MGVTHSRPRLSPILRAIRATEGLGLTVVACYDALYRATTTSWEDVRGGSGGPTITLTGSPTLSNGVYTFNGTDQYGRNASAGRLSEITGSCSLVMIGKVSGSDGVAMVDLSVGATPRALALFTAATGLVRTTLSSSTASMASPGTTNTQVVHARRTQSGGNTTAGIAVGAGNETTQAGTEAAATPTRLTIAGNMLDTPAQKSAIQVRTLVVVSGALGASGRAIWNDYGTLRGATV